MVLDKMAAVISFANHITKNLPMWKKTSLLLKNKVYFLKYNGNVFNSFIEL